MSNDEYVSVNEAEMSLDIYPCGLKSGSYIAPREDIPGERGYLRKGQRCLLLTGNPREPQVIWFRICSTGEIATWDETIMDLFEPAPVKPAITSRDLLGKNILVGLTRFDAADREIGQESHFGKIVEVTNEYIAIQESGKPEFFSIPFATDAIEESDPEQTFSFHGESVSGVNFLSQWRVLAGPPEG